MKGGSSTPKVRMLAKRRLPHMHLHIGQKTSTPKVRMLAKRRRPHMHLHTEKKASTPKVRMLTKRRLRRIFLDTEKKASTPKICVFGKYSENWVAMTAILIFINCEGQTHKTLSTDHNFRRERRAEADSNRGPSAYQPNALLLGQTGSHPLWSWHSP